MDLAPAVAGASTAAPSARGSAQESLRRRPPGAAGMGPWDAIARRGRCPHHGRHSRAGPLRSRCCWPPSSCWSSACGGAAC
ncbi:hypothetical protein SA13R_08975 [Rothia kristinae]|nr:hypothetical protein RSA5_08445 [Rothia kristinae]KTR52098.1 hypothetical protein SA11R_09765 [Rothia kristinae]KTR68262.1 hypothetical protein SA15R_08235 [Rothia kristinae]KTR73385.1 hypothetical protein SA12R_00035 [Rothia kristinae]KTR76367.1 hypothetical protein SA14R_07410 [Rothia kristinae]